MATVTLTKPLGQHQEEKQSCWDLFSLEDGRTAGTAPSLWVSDFCKGRSQNIKMNLINAAYQFSKPLMVLWPKLIKVKANISLPSLMACARRRFQSALHLNTARNQRTEDEEVRRVRDAKLHVNASITK